MVLLNKFIETIQSLKVGGYLPGGVGGLALLMKVSDSSTKIYVTPNEIHAIETPNQLFVVRSLYGEQDVQGPLYNEEMPLTLSKWAPLLTQALAIDANVTCVGVFPAKWAVVASKKALDVWQKRGEAFPDTFRISHWGLLEEYKVKELLLPIIEWNGIEEIHLAYRKAMSQSKETPAVLIRNFGIVIKGRNLLDMTRNLELVERLCELQVISSNY